MSQAGLCMLAVSLQTYLACLNVKAVVHRRKTCCDTFLTILLATNRQKYSSIGQQFVSTLFISIKRSECAAIIRLPDPLTLGWDLFSL